MRGLHLIESARSGHSTSGRHAFLSVSAHGALVLAAVYATTQPSLPRVDAMTDPHVYFVPEPRPATPSPTVARPPRVARNPAAAPTAQPKVAAPAAEAPTAIPAVDVPLTDPSVAAGPPVAEGVASNPVGEGGLPAGGQPFGVVEVEVPAAALSGARPEYPDRAISLGLSGRVSARFIVGKNGRVEDDVVILSATNRDFAAAVRDYLRRARYRPARVGGEPVRQLVEQEFVFQLRR